jgi:alpha-mannosidase
MKIAESIALGVAVLGMLASSMCGAQRIGVTYSAEAQMRYFAGRIPNGASVDLDDSAWQTIQLPYAASAEPVWLRKWIEVPRTLDGYDPTGAKIWLRQPTRGGVTVYVGGKRIARGEDMESLILFNSAKPGDRVLLAIEMDKTNEPKHLREIELHMDFAPGRHRTHGSEEGRG